MGEELENSRIPKLQNIIFSNRFAPSTDGKLWDEDYNYKKFDEKTQELVNSGNFTYIVEADIADYFPRIYKHVLFNALAEKTGKDQHLKSLKKLLGDVFQNVSYGIPVGNSASFLLAEVMIDSIDRRLVDEGFTYCRYVDDIRLFCKSEKEAYHHLEFLASLIFNNLGLTLQQHKTKILSLDHYERIHTIPINATPPISQTFIDFLENEVEFSDPYQIIDFEQLSTEIRTRFDQFDYNEIINEQLSLEQSNIRLIRVVLNVLSNTPNLIAIQNILTHIDKFYPVMGTLLLYFSKIRKFDNRTMVDFGSQLINILRDSYLGESKFIRMWIIYLFTQNNKWGGADEFIRLYNSYNDDFTKRELILAMGKAKKTYWFTAERKDFPTRFTCWVRRAFLRAYSCVAEDEKKHWYDSIKRRNLDFLDEAVIDWAKKNPY
ncbi:hypothetical protein LCGC14_0657080 [marine sediment metagenome]|uniref:Reverse transcriptase domain-containing protein n=1 Tax=marine sediment metagenome TaxID=412755 RepID=A0A0F9REI8_9ZZZZ